MAETACYHWHGLRFCRTVRFSQVDSWGGVVSNGGESHLKAMFELTILPAYGRSYNSKAAIWADWTAGKDFLIASPGPHHGRYINMEDADRSGLACLLVRYGKQLQKSASINLIRGRMN